jgi:hypothetical protein
VGLVSNFTSALGKQPAASILALVSTKKLALSWISQPAKNSAHFLAAGPMLCLFSMFISDVLFYFL